ncbi:MAG: IS1182 family transposase [Actinomycetota bacterium]|nr:IS1182 family transposase [Actinomycetota bacterium]
MSLHPHQPESVPENTARVARAAFPRHNLYIRMRDRLGTIFEDGRFVHLFPRRGQPGESPWRLALVTIFQFLENLSDRQAADAVRGRIDWKYALSLELEDPGFDHTVLSEFRTRLVDGGSERLLLDVLLERFRSEGLLKAGGRQRTDSTHVLAAVRAVNRFVLVQESMRAALESLAVVAPEWLRDQAQPEWVERYGHRAEEYRLPDKKEQRLRVAEVIGADGAGLLEAVYRSDSPGWLRQVPAVDVLRRVWVQNYVYKEGRLRFRNEEDGIPPSSRFISSPYDPDAHYSVKRSTCWLGYKAHLTETCEEDSPNLITNVETTPAPTFDGDATPLVHQRLRERGLLPETHIVDGGYLDAELLVDSQREYGVELLGPVLGDRKWQAKEGKGFDAQSFMIDWEGEKATCPEGHESISWTPAIDGRGKHVIKIKFSTKDCRVCPSQELCIRSEKKYVRRAVTVRPREEHEALNRRREYQSTQEYAKEYAIRAGIESTISEGVRALGLRRTRYVGLARTHLGHVLTAAAIDFLRVGEWLAGTQRGKTRQSRFANLMIQAAAA